jgi:MFS family permease
VLVLSFTWRPALIILTIPGFILAATLWFRIPAEQPPQKKAAPPIKNGAGVNWKTYAPIALFFAAAYLYVLGLRGTDAFATQYFVYGRGLEFVGASILFSTLKVAGLFSAPLCGFLSDRYNRKKVLVTLVIVESVSLYAITITPTVLLAVPCIIFGFAAFGLLGVGEALLADMTPPDQLNRVFGWNFTVNFSSTIILSPVLGFISDNYTFDLGFLLLSAMMPLSIFFILKIKTGSAQQKPGPHHNGVALTPNA